MDWPHTTALVTGGRTGVGHALVQQLLARGAHVVALGRCRRLPTGRTSPSSRPT